MYVGKQSLNENDRYTIILIFCFRKKKKEKGKNLILAEYRILKITLTQIRIKELLLSYIDLKRKEKPIVIV